MEVYVQVMKALLMRSDVRMTSDSTGAVAICWQNHFVVSLLNLWNTTSADAVACSRLAWAAALAVPTVFQESPSSSSSSTPSHASLALVPLLWRQRAWARLAHPLLALARGQEQPPLSQSQPSSSQSSPPSTLSEPGLLALCGMIVALGQVTVLPLNQILMLLLRITIFITNTPILPLSPCRPTPRC